MIAAKIKYFALMVCSRGINELFSAGGVETFPLHIQFDLNFLKYTYLTEIILGFGNWVGFLSSFEFRAPRG